MPPLPHEFVLEDVVAAMFDTAQAKQQYRCDAYFVDLGKKPATIVNDTRYWFGLFSHQRDTSLWKGMLALPLVSDDDAARELLGALRI